MSAVIEQNVRDFRDAAIKAHLQESADPMRYAGPGATEMPPSYLIAARFVSLIEQASPAQKDILINSLKNLIAKKEANVPSSEEYAAKVEAIAKGAKDPGTQSVSDHFRNDADLRKEFNLDVLKVLKQTLAIHAPQAVAKSAPAETLNAKPV